MDLTHLLDTNTIADYLQPTTPVEVRIKVRTLLEAAVPVMSIITEMELLSWRGGSAEDIQLLQSFIADSVVLTISAVVKDATIQVRKQHGLKLPDAIIAASALTQGLTLVTRNEKDFQRVPGLAVINPWSM